VGAIGVVAPCVGPFGICGRGGKEGGGGGYLRAAFSRAQKRFFFPGTPGGRLGGVPPPWGRPGEKIPRFEEKKLSCRGEKIFLPRRVLAPGTKTPVGGGS